MQHVKVERSFIADIVSSPEDRAIVSSSFLWRVPADEDSVSAWLSSLHGAGGERGDANNLVRRLFVGLAAADARDPAGASRVQCTVRAAGTRPRHGTGGIGTS